MRRFLVHVVDLGGPRWSDFMRFRDLLIADPRLAAEYEALKTEAATHHPVDTRGRYTAAKAAFINAVLARQRSGGER